MSPIYICDGIKVQLPTPRWGLEIIQIADQFPWRKFGNSSLPKLHFQDFPNLDLKTLCKTPVFILREVLGLLHHTFHPVPFPKELKEEKEENEEV